MIMIIIIIIIGYNRLYFFKRALILYVLLIIGIAVPWESQKIRWVRRFLAGYRVFYSRFSYIVLLYRYPSHAPARNELRAPKWSYSKHFQISHW